MSPSTKLGTSRPTWTEIDLEAIAHNYHAIKNRLSKGTNILAVVKANAYGYGMAEVARRLAKERRRDRCRGRSGRGEEAVKQLTFCKKVLIYSN